MGTKNGPMEADLTYLDPSRVSTPDGPEGDHDARVSVMGEKKELAAKPAGCASLYEIFLRGMKV